MRLIEQAENQDEEQAFCRLGPEQILDAVEAVGYPCDGRMLALNSYENRVYQLGIEGGEPVVVKFYRPGRWSDAAILEEHGFACELAEGEIPVIAPLADAEGITLHHQGLHRFAVFPRRGGRPPELDNREHLEQLGRFMARIHLVGEIRPFQARPTLGIQEFGLDSYQFLLEKGFIPQGLEQSYRTLAEDLIERIRDAYRRAGSPGYLRLHGDAHCGNILWTGAGPHFVDLDDARMGPAIQDLWMFLSGERVERTIALCDLLEGYTQFRDFDSRELHLIEALRTLRMMHYAAWLGRRWTDPAFPLAFPWFNEPRYWDEHILTLREQAAILDEPALDWD
ncbi:MAG: stress response serine/threonine protein kinase YihE [Gammaproteobacteria bacterium RIFOXYA12_FULL_61_12]|nr:MAG: stress response serine/threonine protein kinase YihE [Gammaproteobacteria bacterium RIFOXYD12_FULL_61_37]OGT91245.1 MAG: stress response serine/threonine protein kinase YihE [Gammaproteobacteria bacterium RIFOXYA12_FULL_61_12]